MKNLLQQKLVAKLRSIQSLRITEAGYENLNYVLPIFDVEDYIEQHDHIKYCEIFILEDGRIIEAKPGHSMVIDSMLKLQNIELDISWFMEQRLFYTKAIEVRYEFQKSFYEPTLEQKCTLQLLADRDIINLDCVNYDRDKQLMVEDILSRIL